MSDQPLDCYDEIKEYAFSQEQQATIQTCVNASFEEENHFTSKNALLEENKNNMLFENVFLIPAVFLQEEMIKENIDVKMVKSAICVKLSEQIPECKEFQKSIKWNQNS